MPAVALDVMSGDAGLKVAIAAAHHVKATTPDWDIILVGDEDKIRAELTRIGADNSKWHIHHASDVISMDDVPARAVRRRNTSMRLALQLVADGKANAAVSAGNTGALMGLGALVLRVIDGISRPAIASFIPNRNRKYSRCMLDLGANVKCTAPMLRDFALMGSALAQSVKGIQHPKVGLLNIGEEQHKGNDLLKDAAKLLEEHPHINFIGNVEGYAIYDSNSNLDVIVCDGFSGNVALKVSEGLAKMMVGMLKDIFNATWVSRFFSLLAYPLLVKIKSRFDHRHYNGAAFVGLRGVLVKSHGNADKIAFAAAIKYAITAAESNLPGIIAEHIADNTASPATQQPETSVTAQDSDDMTQLATQAA